MVECCAYTLQYNLHTHIDISCSNSNEYSIPIFSRAYSQHTVLHVLTVLVVFEINVREPRENNKPMSAIQQHIYDLYAYTTHHIILTHTLSYNSSFSLSPPGGGGGASPPAPWYSLLMIGMTTSSNSFFCFLYSSDSSSW